MKIITRLCRESEAAWCRQNEAEMTLRLLQIFSAKEALYKALFPLCRRFFGFLDAELHPEQQGALFPTEQYRAELLIALHPELPRGAIFQVRQVLEPPYIFSAVALAPA